MISQQSTSLSAQIDDLKTQLDCLMKPRVAVECFALMLEAQDISQEGRSSRIKHWASIASSTATELYSCAHLATQKFLTEVSTEPNLQTVQSILEAHQKSVRKGLAALDKRFWDVAGNATSTYSLAVEQLAVFEVYFLRNVSEKTAGATNVEETLYVHQFSAFRKV